MGITKEQLLAEVEDLLRTMPSREDFSRLEPDVSPWLGRAAAAVSRWNVVYFQVCDTAIRHLQSQYFIFDGFTSLMKLLNHARADLRLEVGQVSVVVQQGQGFDYFDGLRKLVESAREEVYFVDQYLDAEFVPRYLPYVADGVEIRLLGGPKRMSTLLPAVDMFVGQSRRKVSVRSSGDVHERYLFTDRSACYLSGASFKDGPKNAPAVITQIVDAFPAMWSTYDQIWNNSKAERS
jgi:hypothetical protein